MPSKLWLLWQCFFAWRMENDGINGDCFAVFSFGKGFTNEYMANMLKIFRTCNISMPIFAQYEVAHYLAGQKEIISIGDDKCGYLPSWIVAKMMIEKMKERGCKKPIIVGYWLHVWRIYYHFKKYNYDPLIQPNLQAILMDPKSAQKWTTKNWRWIIREIPVRLYCLVKGYI